MLIIHKLRHLPNVKAVVVQGSRKSTSLCLLNFPSELQYYYCKIVLHFDDWFLALNCNVWCFRISWLQSIHVKSEIVISLKIRMFNYNPMWTYSYILWIFASSVWAILFDIRLYVPGNCFNSLKTNPENL